jgi:hypothetical protein
MHEFADIERRIDGLRLDRSLEHALSDMEEVLALGYVSALRADARRQRLGQRIDRLLADLGDRQAADEARRLAQERRALGDAAQRLRTRLGDVRSLVARLGTRQDSV